jgi:hypothetical protein
MQARAAQKATQSRFKNPTKNVGIWLVGLLAGLFLSQAVVRILPGPRAGVTIEGLKPASGNALGCTFYRVRLSNNNNGIDHVYLKIQLPHKITGYKIAFLQEIHLHDGSLNGAQVIEMGRNSGGDCDILSTAFKNNIDILVSAEANLIHVQVSNFAPKSTIEGYFATPDYDPQQNVMDMLYYGGYQYTQLGQVVQRSLKFNDVGVSTLN